MGVWSYGKFNSFWVFKLMSHEWDIELNMRWEIWHFQATMYYFVYYMNILRTRSQLYSCFKKRMGCHSFMALKRVSDMSTADWLSQTCTKLSQFFMSGDTVFLSGGNPLKAL